MYRLLRISIIVVGLLIAMPNALAAQSDWMNLSWGMSYQEVVERQPDARAVTEKHNRQGMFYDVFARLDNITMAGIPFRVDLLFDNEIRLTGVVMKAYGPSTSLSPGYTRLLRELTDQHGRPMATVSIPNHPGNYSWKTNASEIRISYTEMVKGEADIVLAYYQTATVERQPVVVVRRDTVEVLRDTVEVPPPITNVQTTMQLPNPTTVTPTMPDQTDDDTVLPDAKTSLGEFSVQGSTDLEQNGFKSIGFGGGLIGYDTRSKWIQYMFNGYIDLGRYVKSEPSSRLFDGYKVEVKTIGFGLKLGMGVPKANTVLYGIVETYQNKYDVVSGTFVEPSGKDGYQTSVGYGIRYYFNPSGNGFIFGVERSELRRLGVSVGLTF